jgi:hypothetical protein
VTIESIELNQPVDAAQVAFPGATEPAAAAEPGGA